MKDEYVPTGPSWADIADEEAPITPPTRPIQEISTTVEPQSGLEEDTTTPIIFIPETYGYSPEVVTEAIEKCFIGNEVHGKVIGIYVKTGRDVLCGYVLMNSREAAQLLISEELRAPEIIDPETSEIQELWCKHSFCPDAKNYQDANKVLITELPKNTPFGRVRKALTDKISPWGEIQEVYVERDGLNCNGTAYVTMKNSTDTPKVIVLMNWSEFMGNTIRVGFSLKKGPKPKPPVKKVKEQSQGWAKVSRRG